MKSCIRFFVLALAVLFVFAACEGPVGPRGPAGATGPQGERGGIVITINSGGVTWADVRAAVQEAIEQQQAQTGNDGSSEAEALDLSFTGTGLNFEDDVAMKAVFTGIEEYYVNLDLSGVSGSKYRNFLLNASVDKSKILSVTLGDAVTEIANGLDQDTGAFSDFSGLKTISAPKLSKIGNYAFSGCISLTEVSFLAAETLGDYTFDYCTDLTTVDLPSAETLGDYTFSGCTNLRTVSLPAAETLGSSTFDYCSNLTEVNLPAVQTLGDYTFAYCSNLTEVSFPVQAPTLGSSSFYNIGQTVTVKVPADATGYGAIPATYSGNDATVCWANGLRGMGWDGLDFTDDSSSLNGNITLFIIK